MEKSGLYLITCKIDGKRYVGQSYDVKNRLQQHRWNLKNNKDPNEHLQHAYNKYGESAFEFKILQLKPQSIIDDCEKFLIHIFKSNKRGIGYNIQSGGRKHKKHSKETIDKMRDSHKGKPAHENSKRNAAQRVQCLDTGEIFDSGVAACKKYNIKPATLSAHINNPDRHKTAGGHIFIKIT